MKRGGTTNFQAQLSAPPTLFFCPSLLFFPPASLSSVPPLPHLPSSPLFFLPIPYLPLSSLSPLLPTNDILSLSSPLVRGLKLTIPLRREKATSDCGTLDIELDDLQMSLGEPNSPTTSDPTSSRTMTSNHVDTTSPTVGSTSEAVANSNLATTSDLDAQLALITLNTPDISRRGQDSDSSRGNSPSTPGGRGGVAVASTVGVASIGGGGGTGAGRGSGTSSPAPNPVPTSQSQQSIRSRAASNQRPTVAASSSQPRPPQQPAVPAGSMVVHPPQRSSGRMMCVYV